MTSSKDQPFSPEALMAMFKEFDFTKAAEMMQSGAFDPSKLADVQKANLEALQQAGKAASAGFQEMFEAQLSAVEASVSDAQEKIGALATSLEGEERLKAQTDVAKNAFSEAMAQLQTMSQAASSGQQAGLDAVVEQLKTMLDGFKK